MAQPWTTVAWAVWPARPNDPAASAVPEVWLGVSGKPLGRGRLKPLRLHARYDRPAAHRHTHAVQASLAPLYPPYATGSDHHTCLSRSAA